VACALATGSGVAAAPAIDCVAQPFTWFGPQTVAAGTSIDIGTIAMVDPGVQLIVTATDSSPLIVPIQVGGAPVSVGATIAGGVVTVSNTSGDSIEVGSVALGLDRCHEVAVEPPSAPSVATTATSAPEGVDLPETGRGSRRIAVLAATATLGGAGLLALSRRRRHPMA